MLSRLLAVLLIVLAADHAAAQVTVTRGTNFTVDAGADGRLVIDLLDRLWILPAGGGVAEPLTPADTEARRPRWSPDGSSIVYQARGSEQQQMWLYDVPGGSRRKLSTGGYFDQYPAWHPDGERVVFSSDRRETGFDLWETDVHTGLSWRLSDLEGDETEPAYSADGRDLVYIHHHAGQWALMLRRFGEPDVVLETAPNRLSSPAWRPDGSLVTVMRHAPEGITVDMVILAEPLLVRPLLTNEDFFVGPVTWADRQRLLYAAGGRLRSREFNSWTSRSVPFRARIDMQVQEVPETIEARRLPPQAAPAGQLVVRTGRLFDGLNPAYRDGLDIVVNGATISAIEAPRERPGAIVVDMRGLTAIPGLIDVQAELPATIEPGTGPLILSYGVTTLVTGHAQAAELDQRWAGRDTPGPRVLGANWLLTSASAPALLSSASSRKVSPRGIHYEQVQLHDGNAPATVISGLADARTPGLAALLRSRQAGLLPAAAAAPRRYSEMPQLQGAALSIVLGSSANGLPPGIAQHAELRALQAAGLTPPRSLQSASVNAATALGLGLQTGRLAPGATADIVIVDGDPLANVADAQKVVAVIRNGRFHSAIGLIERAQALRDVE